MPVKILLADKSITIQKVVEMLFSGRDYEVICVSDGEAALNEAKRVVPDVVLADIDLPRLDGYSFAARLKAIPQLAQAPVILMMSRDDLYDGAKGKQAGIVDNIAKPFESQELIGKVKKAISATPSRKAEPAPPMAPQPAAPAPPAEPSKPKKPAPPDIFDIISEAPSRADLVRTAATVEEESVYEVEPVVEEVEVPLARDAAKEFSIGTKAVEETAGPGLTKQKEVPQPETVTIKSRIPPPEQPLKPAFPAPTLPEAELRSMVETTIAKMAKEAFANIPPVQPPQISDENLRAMIEEKVSSMTKEALEKMTASQAPMLSASEVWEIAEGTIAKMAKEAFVDLPPFPSPQISDENLRALVEEKVTSMTKGILEKAPAGQPSALTPSDMWSVAEDAVEKIAKELIQKQPLSQAPQLSDEALKEMVEKVAVKTVEEALEKKTVPSLSPPASELRKMAEDAVSRMAGEVFKDLAPPIPKISEETVRRGIEEAVMKIGREVAREVIEKVAWEVIPPLAEVLIKEEIERLKAET
jgi:DNA-binding response OmpR family regulator